MVRGRSRMQILDEVLTLISKGVEKPTNIMQGANLNYPKTQDILGELVDRGLISMEKPDFKDERTTKVYRMSHDE